MKPRTQELLYLLLWHADRLTHPTFRNLTDSFEGWAYRQGFLRQLEELEARQLLERQPGRGAALAIYRLSERGRLMALGGRDPAAQWSRPWDGHWRVVLFDLPETETTARVRLRRFLRSNGFGFLQNSVWVSFALLDPITAELSAHAADVESLITLEARPGAGETNADIVKGAWDFDQINRGYQRCLDVLRDAPGTPLKDGLPPVRLQRWAKLERRTWTAAVTADPLLPDPLLPEGYLGKRVWQVRTQTLAAVARLIA